MLSIASNGNKNLLGAIFIPKISETNNSDMLNMNTVTDFEATKTGLMLYTKDDSGYYWEK